jgi:2-phosphosulfolactate phosphatase
MGEVNGLPIEGFDLPNSPAAIATLDGDVVDRRLIMRTSAGTQGVVCSTSAAPLLVASLCVASATAARLVELNVGAVTFVETGVRPEGGGEEDTACADTIAGLLAGSPLDPAEVERRILGSSHAACFASPECPEFPRADLECALAIDRFPFAMQVTRAEGLFILRAGR